MNALSEQRANLPSDANWRHRVSDPVIFFMTFIWLILIHPRQYWHYFKRLKGTGQIPHPVIPQCCNDKFFWRKVFDHNPLFPVVSDKLAVKKWICDKGIDLLTVPVLWSGTDANAIPDSVLAGNVVVKANHAWRTNILIHNGAYDRPEMVKTANKFLKRNHGLRGYEWGYFNIPRCLFVEKMLQGGPDGLIELTFQTLGSRIERLAVIYDRSGAISIDIWYPDENGKLIRSDKAAFTDLKKKGAPLPSHTAKAIKIAREIGGKFDHMRVDLYSDGANLWLGELTIYNMSGYYPGFGTVIDTQFNKAWDLSKSWFLSTPQRGWRKFYAAALIRRLNQDAQHQAPLPPA